MKRDFCCDEIWNVNETWNTEVPDFSECFQNVVLVIGPCSVFFISGIISVWRLSNFSSLMVLPWTWLNITKMVLCVFLLCISVISSGFTMHQMFYDAHLPLSTVIASVSKCAIYGLVIALMWKHRTSGIVTSDLLSYFWIYFSICGIIMHRSLIVNKDNGRFSSIDFLCGMIYYPIIYLELILSVLLDGRPFESLENGKSVDEASFLSSVSYMWFNKIVYYGLKRKLEVKDFFPLNRKFKSSYLWERFSTYWNFNLTYEDSKQGLALALSKAFWPFLIWALILDILYNIFLFFPPLLIDRILNFVEHETYSWRGYFYCGVAYISVLMGKMLWNNFMMDLLCASLQVKSALINAIYKKNLLLSSSARKDFTSGSISNLVSVDAQRISQFALYSSSLISSPLRVTLIIYIMWQYLGPACLSGAAVIVCLIPMSFFVSRKNKEFTEKQMEAKDIRLKLMNEILNGVKILKLYAWEKPFASKIAGSRKREIKLIRLSQACFVVMCVVFGCAPIVVSIASFATYLFTNSKHVLDPTTAFVSLNLLEQLRLVLFAIPDSISELIQTITSIRRIREFLLAENSDPKIIGTNTIEGEAVSIRNASFSWSKDSEFLLNNITLHVPKGKLIAVIGPVGSGKSSLLAAILGELIKKSGSIDAQGTIAYAPQEAWILNRTLKSNVLFTKQLNERKYSQVLKLCCLEPDLKILPGGDETEIGEKGINLSGGQKHRVSLARAVYQDKDLYLMDDPLSAVDAHVRKSLFKDVISNNGMLKGKTRILATHDISVLPDVDLIVRMEGGEIAETGTYEDLMENEGPFRMFIQTHGASGSEDSAVPLAKVFQRTLSTVSNDSDNSPSKFNRSVSDDSRKQAADLIEDERMEEGGVRRGIYTNYARHMGFGILFISLLGYITYVVFETLANIWLAKWSSDKVLNGTDQYSQTVERLSIYSVFGIAQVFSNMFAVAFLVYASTKAAELYHNEMLESILRAPMSFFDTTPIGRIINRFSTDIDILDVHMIYMIDCWIHCLLFCISTFIVIGMNTPIFLAILLPMGAIYYMFLKLHLNTSRQIRRLESTTRSPIYSHLLESIQGVMPIKAFKVEKEFTDKMQENVDSHVACSYQTMACNRWIHFCLDIIIGDSIVFLASYLAVQNRNSLGPSIVGLIMTYALSVTDNLMWVVRTNTEIENQSVSIERIDEYCHLPSEAPWQVPDTDPSFPWPENGSIVFDNYGTRYRENLDLILHDINLSVSSNEKVGIVGRTGAGKSSVTLALFRIIEPAEGAILIDNIDHSRIGLHTLRSKLTIIPQDPVLFTGSLRFNIDPNDEYSDADVWSSLSNAHLKDFVSNLQEGLEYKVEESGGNLSAGQKQLLCLARALLKKTKILILDEATAAVDMDTDQLIQETIKSEFDNHTVITIAHRLNTIMDYDKVIVMSSGRIIETGNPRELVKDKRSQFHEMAKDAKLI